MSRLSMADLPTQVESDLSDQRLLPRGAKVLVAVSGGLDSVVLLRLLVEFSTRRHWRLHVAHFNHRLRGTASGQDQRWVVRLARTLGLPISVGRSDVRRHASTSGQSNEMAARELRHRFLAETARAAGIQRVALAHHADDQVELFLLRLLRGAGPEGLGGMRPLAVSPADCRVTLVRPLLAVRRSELLEEALRRGWTWREDASNRSLDVLRNRIRHRLIPLLRRDYQPALEGVILRNMELLRQESNWAATAPRPQGDFTDWPVAVQRRQIRRQLEALGCPAGFDRVENLRRQPGRIWSVGPGQHLRLDHKGRIEQVPEPRAAFDPALREVRLRGRSGRAEFGGVRLRWRIEPWTGEREWPRKGEAGRETFDADRVGATVRLRFWRRGDRFQPLGLGGKAKLQDLFVSARIPRDERHRRVLAEGEGGEVFWVQGLRPGHRYRVTRSTRRLLVWEWGAGDPVG